MGSDNFIINDVGLMCEEDNYFHTKFFFYSVHSISVCESIFITGR